MAWSLGPTSPRVKRCRTSHIPLAQTIEPLAACSTPGGLVTTRLAFGDQAPSTVPFGPGASAVAPVLGDDAHAGFSRQHRFRVRHAAAFGWQPVFFVSGLPTLPFAKG